MCQLTYINLHDRTANIVAEYLLSLQNAHHANKDGYGIYVRDTKKVFKTELEPASLTDLGEFLHDEVPTDSPILSHVRSATTTNSKKFLDKEHAHPFESDKLIFAHNGTLDLKDEKGATDLPVDWDNMIDSQRFFYYLNRDFDGTVPTSLQATMEKWMGKFAFLIYDKAQDEYYAARGKIAELYISYLVEDDTSVPVEKDVPPVQKKLGYIINTGNLSLGEALPAIKGIMQILGMKPKFTMPKLLTENSIYKLNDVDIECVGEVLENARPTASIRTTTGASAAAEDFFPRTTLYGTSEKFLLEIATALQSFLNDTLLTYKDLDEICVNLFGLSFFELEQEQLGMLAFKVLPTFRHKAHTKMVSEWRMVLKYTSGNKFLEDNGLQFPYFMNSYKKIRFGARNLEAKEAKV